jgi:hypothetical protein
MHGVNNVKFILFLSAFNFSSAYSISDIEILRPVFSCSAPKAFSSFYTE